MVLRDRASGGEVHGYSAVNVVGCIDATRLEGSRYRLRFGKPCFTGAVAIDEAKAGDRALFRTLHGPGFMVVSAGIADGLRRESWSGLLLQPTAEYAGA
ncbi:hypothetical protein H1235_02335 [Pseudoxanthomonas sp. NC8]|nr:hypothetical protein H1235_02335 [Pseudoxanthomonas sp. NC8]